MSKPEFYSNALGKNRLISDRQICLLESEARRSYFQSIETPLQQSLEEIVGRVTALELIGSVQSNTAEPYSDIDILIITPKKLSKEEYLESNLINSLLIFKYTFNDVSDYILDFWCLVEGRSNNRHLSWQQQFSNLWNGTTWNPSLRRVEGPFVNKF